MLAGRASSAGWIAVEKGEPGLVRPLWTSGACFQRGSDAWREKVSRASVLSPYVRYAGAPARRMAGPAVNAPPSRRLAERIGGQPHQTVQRAVEFQDQEHRPRHRRRARQQRPDHGGVGAREQAEAGEHRRQPGPQYEQERRSSRAFVPTHHRTVAAPREITPTQVPVAARNSARRPAQSVPAKITASLPICAMCSARRPPIDPGLRNFFPRLAG
jgi:hypothetical protein